MQDTIQISFSAAQLSRAALDAAELRMGRAIPPAYREFLLRHNAGVPQPAGFRVEIDDGFTLRVDIAWFLGIATGAYGTDLEWHAREYGPRMPAELLPIARDGGGGLICMADGGAIFYWDPDGEPEPNIQPDDSNIYPLAPSLAAFLQILS